VYVGTFCFIPGTTSLFPGNASLRTRQVDIHVSTFELLACLVYAITLFNKQSHRDLKELCGSVAKPLYGIKAFNKSFRQTFAFGS